MKKIGLFILLASMMCLLAGCSSTCIVSDCDKEVYEEGLCVDHALKMSSAEVDRLEEEIEKIEAEIEAIDKAIEDYYNNN